MLCRSSAPCTNRQGHPMISKLYSQPFMMCCKNLSPRSARRWGTKRNLKKRGGSGFPWHPVVCLELIEAHLSWQDQTSVVISCHLHCLCLSHGCHIIIPDPPQPVGQGIYVPRCLKPSPQILFFLPDLVSLPAY